MAGEAQNNDKGPKPSEKHSAPAAGDGAQQAEGLSWALSELRRKSIELEQVLRGREFVQELTGRLLLMRTELELADELLRSLSILVEADQGSVMLADEHRDVLHVAAASGTSARTCPREVPVTGALTFAMRVGQPVLLGRPASEQLPGQPMGSTLLIPIQRQAEALGVVALGRGVERPAFSQAELQLASTVMATFSAMFDSIRQQRRVKQQLLATIQVLARAIEAKDPYTNGHCERLAAYAVGISGLLGLDPTLVGHIEMGATLHDVGKIGIPEQILTKPDRLTEEEYRIIQRHPVIGAEIIQPVDPPQPTYEAVLHHHERIDGSGYAGGLSGADIPLAARIVAVADAFDAMTVTRPYRKARRVPDALEELSRCAGTQFDREVVDAFRDFCVQEELDRKLTGLEAGRGEPSQVYVVPAQTGAVWAPSIFRWPSMGQ